MLFYYYYYLFILFHIFQTQVTKKSDLLPATVVRSCDGAQVPGSTEPTPTVCTEAGTKNLPGDLGTVSCCKGNLCNAPGGGGGGGAASIVLNLSLVVTGTIASILTACQL